MMYICQKIYHEMFICVLVYIPPPTPSDYLRHLPEGHPDTENTKGKVDLQGLFLACKKNKAGKALIPQMPYYISHLSMDL